MNTEQAHKSSVKDEVNEHELWFDKLIDDVVSHIKEDKEKLASGDADKSTREFYSLLKNGDTIGIAAKARSEMSKIVVREMVMSYFKLITERAIGVSKLALDLSANKVLVWAEITDDDDKTEKSLIRVESMINAMYAEKTGINLDSTIVETSDNLPIPTHYKSVALS